ncbi:ABC transporter permease [Agrococcus sp. SCSIO52902]|uniref:ABC transporter permease n=1 Tax=Agrococcus sp. SCSIO52902 TaxID=2933290 RepID=UPI001FF56649|nr:ABC transporter permease [Agrococcus sp. SCSIO52902]UOW01331.1 ABC transporter permease [Agrococcus sp. SCSIO52902]
MTASAPAPPRRGIRPGHVLRCAADRVRIELLQYFRRSDALVFTFLFPVLLFAIFASAFGALPPMIELEGQQVTQPQYYLPAMLAAGVFLSGVQNLGIEIAVERNDGTLQRLAATPLPVLSYFLGKLGQLLVTSLAQAGLLLAVAVGVFGIELPTEPERWLTLAWVFFAALICFAVLGVVIAQIPRTVNSASAVVIPLALLLQFISGIYLAFPALPEWLQTIANLFPLAWVGHGMRYALLPDIGRYMEVGEAWNLPMVALVLGIWAVVGTVVAAVTFRWIRRS